ncbi:MAG TPA: hypothetical protein VM841_10915 [Actinomycetota bacterium]|nr:hypothetical protein [Actinomycetota bacterium]
MNLPRRSVLALICAVATIAGNALAATGGTASSAVPRAICGPGSDPETGMQGRVTAEDIDGGRAGRGFTCNTEIIGRHGSTLLTGGAGGYKVFRFVDAAGRECGYYDSTLLLPMNVARAASDLPGVVVLDMADPSSPRRTANLVTPAMLSPHESMSINVERGLLAAVAGNPLFKPGFVDIYDISQDCRKPVLMSSTPTGILGHEGAFSPDGNTFWVTSTNLGFITAIDVTNPRRPSIVWTTRGIGIHGFSISDDGTRFYGANAGRPGLTILDVSQVQARAADPVVAEISHITWPSVSIPQHTIPVTIGGRPYLIEIDEFARGTVGDPNWNVGAARIIDISNERSPVIVSDIRLEVHDPGNGPAIKDDPGAQWGLGGYTGHYCGVPQRHEPGIVACSFILSGLRVFDIRDPRAPREIAYFNAPISAGPGAPGGSNGSVTPHAAYAMSAPAFVPERAEIWYTDGTYGFFGLRVTNGVWPFTG